MSEISKHREVVTPSATPLANIQKIRSIRAISAAVMVSIAPQLSCNSSVVDKTDTGEETLKRRPLLGLERDGAGPLYTHFGIRLTYLTATPDPNRYIFRVIPHSNKSATIEVIIPTEEGDTYASGSMVATDHYDVQAFLEQNGRPGKEVRIDDSNDEGTICGHPSTKMP